MQTRPLGRTGITTPAIGLGLEHLGPQPFETVEAVLHEAIDHGIAYLDLMLWTPESQDKVGKALAGQRAKVVLAGHLGVAHTNGQYRRTLAPEEAEPLFHDLLRQLRTDHVDVLHVSNIDAPEDYERCAAPGGLFDLGRRFISEGRARFLGMSGHYVPTALRAIAEQQLGVIMQPVNVTMNPAMDEQMRAACIAHGVGLAAMKPFAGGRIFRVKDIRPIDPLQCLSYALAQPGVSVVVPGVRNLDELRIVLAYDRTPASRRDYTPLVQDWRGALQRVCTYCSHCLPCPAEVDIVQTLRLYSDAQGGGDLAELRKAYMSMPTPPHDCYMCGVCDERCPFGVPVAAKISQAIDLFEA